MGAMDLGHSFSSPGLDHRQALIPVLTTGTIVLLTAVRLGLFYGGRCFMLPARPRLPRGAEPVPEDRDTDQMLRVVAQLLLDIFLHPSGLVLVIVKLAISPIMDTGFTHWTPSMDVVMSLTLGQVLSQGLITIWMFPGCNLRSKPNAWIITFHYLAAACLYGYILYSRKGAILGIVGIVSQFPLLHIRAKRLLFKDLCPRIHVVNLVLSVVLTAVLSISVPALILGIAASHQNPLNKNILKTVDLGVFMAAGVYFGCVYLFNLTNSIMGFCSKDPGPKENQPLLVGRDVAINADDGTPSRCVCVLVVPRTSDQI